MILVDMKMPKNCSECLHMWENRLGQSYCKVCYKMIPAVNLDKIEFTQIIIRENRPEFCPLKPLPDKIAHSFVDNSGQYKLGWNDYIKHMEGKTK